MEKKAEPGGEGQMEVQQREIRDRLEHITSKLLVMSGKGGVGKSSVAAYLSVALSKRGYRVGLMDVDLHGPNIPHLLGLDGQLRPGSGEDKMLPVSYGDGMEVISIETLMGDKDAATIWRGPLKGGGDPSVHRGCGMGGPGLPDHRQPARDGG
jgi:Mrp family chromosome partitioning ATPase